LTLKVSVIIPTWNRAPVLARAIDSVRAQTFAAWELIIVDDGSTDDTDSVCRRYLTDPRVRCQRIENQGVSAARNQGMRLARSQWFAFLDSDDAWMPAKLEKQFEKIAATGDWICHTDEIWIRRGRRVNPMKKHQKPGGWIFEQCLPLCAISPSSSLVHRRVPDCIGDFDTEFDVCEDYEFWLRATAKYRVSLLDEPLITKFGGHEDQLSRKYWGMDRWRVKALHARLQDSDLRLEWRHAVADEILRKTEILMRGYRNNQRILEAGELQEYWKGIRCWREAAAAADPPPLPAVINRPISK